MNDVRKIIIAIDGYSSCGKSTLAKDLAKHLHYKYIDSGAMYRAVSLYCHENHIDILNQDQIVRSLDQINIDFNSENGVNTTYLNGQNVEDKIRSLLVSSMVSEVAAIPEVRHKLVEIQKSLGVDKGIVMDGRDITTVVFPQAELKLFLTADINVRIERRFQELIQQGKTVSREMVEGDLKHRDHIDTTRQHSPLIRTESSFLIDNTYLNRSEQLEVALFFKDYVCR
ncbi:MAG TPA: (d)CMP kinase [Saprospiraceae bacterium]|nr:(d)CMP kinase [Saprospiraceae bacterium]